MPRVPVAEGFQVREQQFQPTQQTAPDVGASTRVIAKGLGDVAEVFDKIAVRDDTEAAFTAETKVKAGWLEADSQLRKKYRGGNVEGYNEEVRAYWDKASSELGGTLSPRARAMVGKSLGQARMQAEGGALRYYDGEKERSTVEAWSAAKATTIQMAITDGSPAAIEAARLGIREKNAIEAARTGRSVEELGVQNLRDLTGLHLEFINGLAPRDAEKAKAYFNQYKDEIEGSRHDTVNKVLKGESDNQFATTFAAENAGLTLAQQLEKAAAITDPDRKKKAIQEVKQVSTLKKEAQAEKEREYSDKAWQMVGQGKRVPEIILQNMDGKERVQLQEHLRTKAERGNAPVKTNPAELAKIYDLARDNPAEFKKLRMVALTTSISSTDMEQVAGLQRKMLSPSTEKDVASTTQLLGVYTAGLKAEKKAAFQNAAYDELNRIETTTGKPASYEEKKKVLDRLIVSGEVLSGSIFLNDPNKKFYQLNPEERARFKPDVNSSERKMIRQALLAEGVANPTEDQVVERFKLAKGLK